MEGQTVVFTESSIYLHVRVLDGSKLRSHEYGKEQPSLIKGGLRSHVGCECPLGCAPVNHEGTPMLL